MASYNHHCNSKKPSEETENKMPAAAETSAEAKAAAKTAQEAEAQPTTAVESAPKPVGPETPGAALVKVQVQGRPKVSGALKKPLMPRKPIKKKIIKKSPNAKPETAPKRPLRKCEQHEIMANTSTIVKSRKEIGTTLDTQKGLKRKSEDNNEMPMKRMRISKVKAAESANAPIEMPFLNNNTSLALFHKEYIKEMNRFYKNSRNLQPRKRNYFTEKLRISSLLDDNNTSVNFIFVQSNLNPAEFMGNANERMEDGDESSEPETDEDEISDEEDTEDETSQQMSNKRFENKNNTQKKECILM